MQLNRGTAYNEFENIIRIVATDHFESVKTERSLITALEKFDRLDAERDKLKAGDMHELMRCHETMNIHEVAKIMASAALAHKESRFAPHHYRADFTETDDEIFCGLIAVSKGADGHAHTRFERLDYAV